MIIDHSAFGLPVEPIRGFDQKRISRIRVEQLLEVPKHVLVSRRWLKVVPSLIPDQEQGRAGFILPPHDEIRVEELDVEITGPRPGERLEASVVAARARRAGQ